MRAADRGGIAIATAIAAGDHQGDDHGDEDGKDPAGREGLASDGGPIHSGKGVLGGGGAGRCHLRGLGGSHRRAAPGAVLLSRLDLGSAFVAEHRHLGPPPL